MRSSGAKLLVALAACAASAAVLSPAGPSAGQAPSLNGTWRLQGTPAQAQASVERTIGPAIAAMDPEMQRLARARIAETTWIPSVITITATSSRISVAYQGAENRTFDSTPGQAQNVYSRSGVRARLTQSYRSDGAIQQQFVALDGTQWNWLVPDPSGRLLYLDVRMRSPRFSHEITFRLVYQRAQ